MDLYRFDRQGNLEVRRGVHAVDSPAYFRDGWSQTPPEKPAIDVTAAPEKATPAIAPTPAIAVETEGTAPRKVESPLSVEEWALEKPQEVEIPTPKRRTRKPALEG